MLVAKIFLVVVFFSVSYALTEEIYSRYSHIFRFTDNQFRIKKRQNEPEYYEQCRFVNMWKEQLGHVSVLAFLDPSWQYSFRQAIMLKLLNTRLKKSGFLDIWFFVIAPPSNLTTDKTESDIEIQAWKEISMLETENFVNANDHLLKKVEPELIFIQDDPQTRIWERFRASKNQMVVIDRCGKLTYQVIVPWSILYFPYVKAAILSTYLGDPCGACDPTIHKTLDYNQYFMNLMNDTEKETATHKTDNINSNPIWTTERYLENITESFNESLKNELEASTISFTPSVEILNDTTNSQFVNITESIVESETIYQYDSTTEPIFSINNPTERMENQEKSVDLNNTTPSNTVGKSDNETTMTSVLKSTVSSMRDDSVSYEDTRNHSLLDEAVDEIKSTPFTIETISSKSDELQGMNPIEVEDSEMNFPNVKNEILPLRIIMYAPHTHRNGKKTKKHMHLILKTGKPDYHGHLDPEKDVSSLTNLWRGVDSETADSEDHEASGLEADKEITNQKYIFDKDESPGLYGEVVDYWRSCENSDITDRNETSNNSYNNSTLSYNEEYHTNNITNHVVNSSKSAEIDEKYSTTKLTIDANVEDSIINLQNITELQDINSSKKMIVNDQVNKEEEMRNKLIEHYNKLLPWIYYILNK